MKLGRLNILTLDMMLISASIGIVMKMMQADEVWIFTIACLAIVLLVGHDGPVIGGFSMPSLAMP